MFLCEGTLTVKYLSAESLKVADAAGITKSIETAFNRFGVMSFTDKVSGLKIDGANVKVRVHRGVGTQFRKKSCGSKSFTNSTTGLN